MKTINIQEARTQFSRLLERLAAGEEFIIAKDGKPIARLIKIREEGRARIGGQWKGMVRVSPDFDDPLSDVFERS